MPHVSAPRSSLVLLALLLLAAAAHSQDPADAGGRKDDAAAIRASEPPAVSWSTTLESALESARAQDSFVFVALPVDRNGEGDGVLRGPLWRDRSLREALAGGRSVVGSSSRHVESEAGHDREGRELPRFCSRWGAMLCEQHRENDKRVLATYFDGEEPAVRPVYLVLRGSDGAVLARQVGDAPPDELAEIVRAATMVSGEEASSAIPSELLGKVGDAHRSTRRQALRVLAALRSPAARAALERRFEDAAQDDAMRADIAEALASAGSPDLVASLVAHLEARSAELRGAAARALGASGSLEARAALVKALPKALGEEERGALVLAIGRTSRADDETVGLLRREAASSRAAVRASAVLALGAVGARRPETEALLRERAKSDAEARVRAAAIYALARWQEDARGETADYLASLRAKEKDPRLVQFLGDAVSFLGGRIEVPLAAALGTILGGSAR